MWLFTGTKDPFHRIYDEAGRLLEKKLDCDWWLRKVVAPFSAVAKEAGWLNPIIDYLAYYEDWWKCNSPDCNDCKPGGTGQYIYQGRTYFGGTPEKKVTYPKTENFSIEGPGQDRSLQNALRQQFKIGMHVFEKEPLFDS